MKKNVLFAVFAFVFVFSVFSQNRSVVAEYRCELEDGSATGYLILYSDGYCEITRNGKDWGLPVFYQLDERQIRLWGKYSSGVSWENVWTLIPRVLNGQNYYESIWSHSFYNGQADNAVILPALGCLLAKGGRVNGKMTKIIKNATKDNTSPSSPRIGPEIWNATGTDFE